MNEELRNKIAKWLGWEFHADGVHWRSSPDVLGCSVLENLPDFPNDLNACFEYTVPKLKYFSLYYDRGLGWLISIDDKNRVEMASEESPALALCRAVEKLIQGEEDANTRGG